MHLPIPSVLRVLRTRLQLALGLRRSQHVRVMRDTTAMLAQEGAVLRVLTSRLLLALGLRRSPHVRVMPGTTVTLYQAHAAHARLADTRLLAVTEVSRRMSALRVQRTRLPMPLGLRRCLTVSAV